MYHVTVDSGRRLIWLRATGFVNSAEYVRMDAELAAAAARLRKESNADFTMLFDLREAALLSKEQVDDFEEKMERSFENGVRKAAFVASTALIKMQVSRTISPSKSRLFESEEDALSWLAD